MEQRRPGGQSRRHSHQVGRHRRGELHAHGAGVESGDFVLPEDVHADGKSGEHLHRIAGACGGRRRGVLHQRHGGDADEYHRHADSGDTGGQRGRLSDVQQRDQHSAGPHARGNKRAGRGTAPGRDRRERCAARRDARRDGDAAGLQRCVAQGGQSQRGKRGHVQHGPSQ